LIDWLMSGTITTDWHCNALHGTRSTFCLSVPPPSSSTFRHVSSVNLRCCQNYILCGRPNRPQCGSCSSVRPSICLSVSLSRTGS